MIKKITKIFLLILIFNLLLGCNGNWGEKYKAFISNNAHSLSRQYANNDLKRKWQLLFQEYYISLNVKINVVVTALNTLETNDVIGSNLSGKKLLNRTRNTHLKISQLIELESEIIKIKRMSKAINSICINKKMFYRFKLEKSILVAMMSVVSPKLDTEIYVSNDEGSMIGWVVSNVIDRKNFKEQEEEFSDAQNILKEQVIHDDELFLLSKNICLLEKNDFIDFHKKLETVLRRLKKDIKARRNLFYKQTEEYEAYLMPELIENTLRLNGGWEDMKRYSKLEYEYKLDKDIEELYEVLRATYHSISAGKNKIEMLDRIDTYRDYLYTSVIQLNSYLKIELRPVAITRMKQLIKHYEKQLKETNSLLEVFRQIVRRDS